MTPLDRTFWFVGVITTCLAVIGGFGIGDFRLYYGPEFKCVERSK